MSKNKRARVVLHVRNVLLLGACLVLLGGCGRTPQLAGDKESLSAADALWTAVTARRDDLVDRAAGEIESLHAAGKMPDDAFEALKIVIVKARTGQWSGARQALKSLLRGQRGASSGQ